MTPDQIRLNFKTHRFFLLDNEEVISERKIETSQVFAHPVTQYCGCDSLHMCVINYCLAHCRKLFKQNFNPQSQRCV